MDDRLKRAIARIVFKTVVRESRDETRSKSAGDERRELWQKIELEE